MANSRDMDGSPLFLDGDSWQGLPGELSPSSEEPPVTHSEPTHPCPLLLQLWGRGAFHTHVAQGADGCPSPPQPRGSWPSPPGRRRDEWLPPTLLTVSSSASRPAGTPQSSSRKKSPRPPKQAKSTRAPALTAGAPHHGKSLAGLPSANLDQLGPPACLPESGLAPHPTPPSQGTQVSVPGTQAPCPTCILTFPLMARLADLRPLPSPGLSFPRWKTRGV